MDTRFLPLETNSLWPGDKPIPWQMAMTEERSQRATEIHNVLVPDPPEFCCIAKLPRVPPKAGRMNFCIGRGAGRTIVCFSNPRNFERRATRRFQAVIH
jgi:hypothetical protein